MVTFKGMKSILKLVSNTFAMKIASVTLLCLLIVPCIVKGKEIERTFISPNNNSSSIITFVTFKADGSLKGTATNSVSTNGSYILSYSFPVTLSNKFSKQKFDANESLCFSLKSNVTINHPSFDGVFNSIPFGNDYFNSHYTIVLSKDYTYETTKLKYEYIDFKVDYSNIAKSYYNDIYFKITNLTSSDVMFSNYNKLLFVFANTTNYTQSPFGKLNITTTGYSINPYEFSLLSCDEAPFKKGASSEGGSSVNNGLLVILSIGIFSIFLYMVFRDIFRK